MLLWKIPQYQVMCYHAKDYYFNLAACLEGFYSDPNATTTFLFILETCKDKPCSLLTINHLKEMSPGENVKKKEEKKKNPFICHTGPCVCCYYRNDIITE